MWESVGGLIGRTREAAALRDWLTSGHRLMTVAGPVGVGKSALAAAVVDDVGGQGAAVVRVRWRGTRAATASALVAAVARALPGAPPPGPPRKTAGTDDLVRRMRGADTLLLLDDVDPVRSACVGLVQTLLEFLPGLRVLVTARQPLGLGDERVLRLGGLGTEVAEPEGAGPAPAVALFLLRARAADRADCAEPAVLDAVVDICRSLDGLPLAVELAAYQVAEHAFAQAVRALAVRLRRHQCWLSSARVALPRHRSLRDAVAAVHTLCEPAERSVWNRAAVFAGAFDESTAVFVCAGGGVEPHHVPALLARLAAVGVLEPVRDPGGLRPPRYRMARAARDYGAERLRESGEAAVAADRHLIHCRRVAEAAANLWHNGGQRQAVRLVLDERDDLRAMLRDAPGRADHTAVALAIVVDLWFWWGVHGDPEEGRRHLLRLLPLCATDTPEAVRGLWLAAWLTARSDPAAANGLLGRAWTAAVLAGDDATVGRVAHVQGLLALHRREPRTAAGYFDEAARAIPDHAPGGPSATVSLAALAVTQSQFAPRAADRSARRALTAPGLAADAWACFLARTARALVDHRLGRTARAWHRARRVLTGVDPTLPAPHGATALRRLLADIETGVPPDPGPDVPAGPSALSLSAPASVVPVLARGGPGRRLA